ncbi:MAG: hypothetical protein IJ438_10165 [Clostridia bacterium]|nr:hypothetical protein [Clostridia bacterium]
MSERDNETRKADVTEASSQAAPAAPGVTDEDQLLLDKYSRMFTGTFAHSLDSKGRMVIPLAFREMLGTTFSITPAFDFKSIAVYPEVAYVRMREKYARAGKRKNDSNLQNYLQWLDAYTFRAQECDGQGRVLLPARLRQIILGEDKDIDIMGSGDHLRIAARAKCDDQLQSFMANLDSILSGISTLDDDE